MPPQVPVHILGAPRRVPTKEALEARAQFATGEQNARPTDTGLFAGANDYFRNHLPDHFNVYGPPFFEKRVLSSEAGQVEELQVPTDINPGFWNSFFGVNGPMVQPFVFVETGAETIGIRRYNAELGIYEPQTENDLFTRLVKVFERCTSSLSGLRQPDAVSDFASARRIRGLVKLIITESLTPQNQLQRDGARHLVFQNGTLDLRDGKLNPHTKHLFLLRRFNFVYNPQADARVFERTLLRSFSPEDRERLQDALGSLLFEKNMGQRIIVFTGDAGWGKGTLVSMMRRVIGDDAFGLLDDALFGATRETELWHLRNKRVLLHPDMPMEFLDRSESEIMKRLVGNDPIRVRRDRHAEPQMVNGDFHMLVCVNGLPRIYEREDAEAWSRRLAFFEFKEPGDEVRYGRMDDNMLITDSGVSGFVNWLLKGKTKQTVAQYQLPKHASHAQFMDKCFGRVNNQMVHRFVDERIELADDATITVDSIRTAWRTFAAQQGEVSGKDSDTLWKTVRDVITTRYAVRERHDITGEDGRQGNGFKGVRLKS